MSVLRKLTPPAALSTAANTRLGRRERLWNGAAAAFSQTIRGRYQPGGGDLYPDAWLVLREEEEAQQTQSAGDVNLTQFTLRLLIQLSETMAVSKTETSAMEIRTLQNSISTCLTALESRDREQFREIRTLQLRLAGVSDLPENRSGRAAAEREIQMVRKTAERWFTETAARPEPREREGIVSRRGAAPAQTADSRSPSAAQGETSGPETHRSREKSSPHNSRGGEEAPRSADERDTAAASPHGGTLRARAPWQTPPAAGPLRAYGRVSASMPARTLRQKREEFITLLSTASREERETVWQAAEVELAHFPGAAGESAEHTPELLAGGLRAGTEKEWTRLLQRVERRLTISGSAQSAPGTKKVSGGAMPAAAASAAEELRRSLENKPLNRKALLAALQKEPEEALRALVRLADESGVLPTASKEGASSAPPLQRQLKRLIRESSQRQLEKLERQLRERAEKPHSNAAAGGPSPLLTFLRGFREERELTRVLAEVPAAQRRSLLRELIPRQRELPAAQRLWEQAGLSETQRLVYLLQSVPGQTVLPSGPLAEGSRSAEVPAERILLRFLRQAGIPALPRTEEAESSETRRRKAGPGASLDFYRPFERERTPAERLRFPSVNAPLGSPRSMRKSAAPLAAGVPAGGPVLHPGAQSAGTAEIQMGPRPQTASAGRPTDARQGGPDAFQGAAARLLRLKPGAEPLWTAVPVSLENLRPGEGGGTLSARSFRRMEGQRLVPGAAESKSASGAAPNARLSAGMERQTAALIFWKEKISAAADFQPNGFLPPFDPLRPARRSGAAPRDRGLSARREFSDPAPMRAGLSRDFRAGAPMLSHFQSQTFSRLETLTPERGAAETGSGPAAALLSNRQTFRRETAQARQANGPTTGTFPPEAVLRPRIQPAFPRQALPSEGRTPLGEIAGRTVPAAGTELQNRTPRTALLIPAEESGGSVPARGRTAGAFARPETPLYQEEAQLELLQGGSGGTGRGAPQPVIQGSELPHTREIRQLREQEQTISGQKEEIGGLKAQLEQQKTALRGALNRAVVPPAQDPGEVRKVTRAVMREMEDRLRLERQRRGLS